ADLRSRLSRGRPLDRDRDRRPRLRRARQGHPLPGHDVAPAAREPRPGERAAAGSVTSPLAAADAARRVLNEVRRQPPLRVPLDDALDSVLAEEIVSPLDIPPWANSAMDGYAVRGEDVAGASEQRPVRLRVVEQVPAGSFPTRSLAPGESIRIF